MKEIKFLKDLPIKLTNSVKPIDVVGGDIYYDSEGNRYGYITFKNTQRSPIFCLQLFIREYSIDGKFIKDNELFDGYCFYPSGEFVINQPIIFDKETEAIEVTIVKLTLKNKNFLNDRYVGFKQSDYADLYQRKAPVKKPGTAGTFNFVRGPEPVQGEAPVGEEPVQQVVNETPVSDNQTVAVSATPSAETPTVGEAPAATPVVEAPVNVESLNNFAKKQKDFFRYIPVAVAFVALVALAFFVMIVVTGGVNAFNETVYY